MPGLSLSEIELYPHVERYLNINFAPRLKLTLGANLPIVAITATRGPVASGMWSRPDLAIVNIWRHKFQPAQQLDLYGFEVKRDGGCDLSSVHETLAHTRLVHFAFLVWHYRAKAFDAPLFTTMRDNCAAYGLGLITFHDLDDPTDVVLHLDAKRATPDIAQVDAFIDTRFGDEQKARLTEWIERGR